MAKVQHISGITKRLPFEGLDFYELFRITFENSELGHMKRLLPLREMAVNFGLVPARHERKRGPKPFFSPEGKVALMFLKMYTQLIASSVQNIVFLFLSFYPFLFAFQVANLQNYRGIVSNRMGKVHSINHFYTSTYCYPKKNDYLCRCKQKTAKKNSR